MRAVRIHCIEFGGFEMTVIERAITRRTCARILAAAALGGLFRPKGTAEPGAISRLTWAAAESATSYGRDRHYRANAQILVLSLPLVRWPNVGGGSALWHETDAPASGTLRLLEFTGFSRPERAAGLNRLGFIRELSRVRESGAVESLYFGLMTASPEETADEARKALHPAGKEATYTAIDGHLARGTVETVVAHFTAPTRWSMANRDELVARARAALSTTPPRPPEAASGGAEMRPFLHVLADALGEPGSTDSRFAYAGRAYRLSLEKAADPKATASFRERGLVSSLATVVRATGKVGRETGGKESTFRLWFEASQPRPLPLRIEYHARAFLRLIFEAEG